MTVTIHRSAGQINDDEGANRPRRPHLGLDCGFMNISDELNMRLSSAP